MADGNERAFESGSREEEEFNNLLSAAAKKINKSPDEGSKPAPAPSSSSSGGGKLTQEQIEALLNSAPPAGEITDEFIEEVMNNTELESAKKEKEAQDSLAGAKAVPMDNDETDRIVSMFEAELNSEKNGGRASAGDDGIIIVNTSPDGIPEEIVGKKHKNLGFIITVAAAVVAFALGFCVCFLFFSDFIKSGSEEFAIKAANALNSQFPVNNDLYIYKAYVKDGTASTECILYGAVDYNGETKMDIYRVVVRDEDPNKISVYYTVDENDESYIAMKNSSDSEVKVQASILKNYSDTIMAADKEIRIGVPEWEKIDCTKINRNITSSQKK